MTTTTLDFSAQTTLNLTLRTGIGAIITVTVTRGGVAVNLTGATIRYYAKTSTPIDKTIGSGITVATPASGIFTLIFTAENTASLGSSKVVHECRVKLATEEPAMLFEGVLEIEAAPITSMSA